MPFKIRRGPESERQRFVPSEGELLYTTDTKNLYVGDGIALGGNLVRGYIGSNGGNGYTGSVGDPGPRGRLGYTGSRGYVGSRGLRGDQGYPGPIGPMGDVGPCGPNGFTGSAGAKGDVGTSFLGFTQNVLYVSKNGNDANDGTTFDKAKLTVKSALSIATSGTTIYVRSGDYTENNPMTVPAHVSIVGDNLRTVTIRPLHKTQDLFYVNNGCYISNMTFKDHLSPAAAVAFKPDESAGVIYISPYIQNCTSMTTTGTGVFIDGDQVGGTKSMVMDAFTQFNQGGIGVHITNRGYAQLVSIFTICCDKAVYCQNGGYCSITNSNNSFGNYALYADGISDTLYTGKFQSYDTTPLSNSIVVNGLTTQPNINDAIVINGDTDNIYTVSASTPFTVGSTEIVEPSYSSQSSNAINARSNILDALSTIQLDTINYINSTYPDFDYDRAKCTRDIKLIVSAVVDDMIFGTNYRTVVAGRRYYSAVSSTVVTVQLTETVAAVNFVKSASVALINTTPEITAVTNRFNILIDIMTNGLSHEPALIFQDPLNPNINRSKACAIIRSNRSFFVEEAVSYIAVHYPSLIYDVNTCRRDVGYIVDAVSYDMLYGGNLQTAVAADAYYSGGVLQVPSNQKQASIDTFAQIGTICAQCVVNTIVSALNTTVTQNRSLPAASSTEAGIVTDLFGILTNLIQNAYSSTVTFLETVPNNLSNGNTLSFCQFSLITASGQSFEWVGTGTNVNTALPALGAVPIQENQVVEVNGGRVYYTGSDQKGNFFIGDDLLINRAKGTIEGRAFNKSLFAVMTPYILAIGG